MKKYILGLLLLITGMSIYLPTYADNNCRDVDFDNGRICMSINKESNGEFRLNTDQTSGNGTLSCRIMLEENNKVTSINNCNDTFYVNKGELFGLIGPDGAGKNTAGQIHAAPGPGFAHF